MLVADTARNDLLRLEGASGRVRWRQSIGEPFDAYPVIAGREHPGRHPRRQTDDRGGGLRRVARLHGCSAGFSHRAGADTHRSLAYQVADHTNVFIMSLDDNTCQNVAYLGHEPGTVLTTPVVVDDFLLVAINGGAHDSTLNVFLIQPRNPARPNRGSSPCSRSSSAGTCRRRRYLDGRRLLLVTSSGTVRDLRYRGHRREDAAAPGGRAMDRRQREPGARFRCWWAANAGSPTIA